MNLGCLAVLFGRHTRLEERNWGAIEIELGSDTLLGGHWLVGKTFEILVCLDVHVHATGDWLRRGNGSIRVDESWPLFFLVWSSH